MAFLAVLSPAASAQDDGSNTFFNTYSFMLRIAEAPCPAGIDFIPDEAVCYRHGYSDFFDFKEAFNPLIFDVGEVAQPWRVATQTLDGEEFEAFTLRLSQRNSREPISVTYVSETLLYIEHPNVSATP